VVLGVACMAPGPSAITVTVKAVQVSIGSEALTPIAIGAPD
jgi:hypothetical protein